MFMQLVGYHYGNKLGDSGKKQVSVQCFFVLCFTSCHTKTVLEVVDGLFHIYPDFISGIPFLCSTGCSWISTEILLGIDIYHSSAERGRAWIVTVADTMGFLCSLIPFPLHFGTDKFHGWKSAAQMGFTAFPFHGKGNIFRTTGDAICIHGIIVSLNVKLVFQWNVSFLKGSFL